MPTLLQINSTANWGSTGKIAEQIGILAMKSGWESYIAYGRNNNPSKSKLVKIGSKLGVYWHVLESRLLDNHGLASRLATRKLIKQIELIKPDIVHLHNIHGYYINYKLLFEYLSKRDIRVVWTLHDCWSFTGHCAHFVADGCYQWQTACRNCKCYKGYPASLTSRAKRNFEFKKSLFLSVKDRLTLTPVSKWLASQTEQSFFNGCNITYIYNGVDTSVFSPIKDSDIRSKYNLGDKKILLGVASAWGEGKGLGDYYKLRERLTDDYIIVLVGMTDAQINALPNGIVGIRRTQSQHELAELYSAADIVLSLSRAETFGLTIAEGMACGTPAIVYNTTAVPELITPQTGLIIDNIGDIDSLIAAIETICSNGKEHYSEACRKHAEQNFDKDKCFAKYIELYNEILAKK